MWNDEPADDDLRRLDRDTAFCPDCGAEIWDQAEACPACRAWLGGDTASRRPRARRGRAVVLGILIGLLVLSLIFAMF